jgi:hypothetical protein
VNVLVDADVADPAAALAMLAGVTEVTVLVVEQAAAFPPAPMGQVASPVPDEAPSQLGREMLHDAARRQAQSAAERARTHLSQPAAVLTVYGSSEAELVQAVERGAFDVAIVTPEHAAVVRLLRKRSSPCAVLVVPPAGELADG